MRVQLWSCNYDPEPTGIGPVSLVFAQGLRDLGHQVEVIAAHPHYPEPQWGRRWRPYREVRDGIPVLRLPLWIGRDTALARYRQEGTFAIAQMLAVKAFGRPDVRVVVSPSFPALGPAIVARRMTSVPWVLWIQDILPDGAAASELVDEGSRTLELARKLERAAYKSADQIAVVSDAFTRNLLDKGVPSSKLTRIYNPASRIPRGLGQRDKLPIRILSMGNIGQSQGLAEVVEAFEREPEMNSDTILTITGGGVAEAGVRAAIRTGRVVMRGVVSSDELEWELERANVALVTQRPMSAEFNLPSKLMNFMAYGLPVIAVVDPTSEVARIVRDSGAGWVVDSAKPAQLNEIINYINHHPNELDSRAKASLNYGQGNFLGEGFAATWERELKAVVLGERR